MQIAFDDERHPSSERLIAIKSAVQAWALELGFQQLAVSDIELDHAEARHREWLSQGFHGEMEYLARHGTRRSHPDELIPGTSRVICVRLNYLSEDAADGNEVLSQRDLAYVSRYALGRDYHKVLRNRLQQLVERLQLEVAGFNYRVFTDSAPVMEVELASKSGLGWRGKHTLLLNREAGSWFFLGEIYTDLPLPVDQQQTDHCGTCQRCITVCPTQAILAPYKLDARRCISYLTIEHSGSIPEPLRRLMGNRIYGCDDCQLVCPWNRFAQTTPLPDFEVRHGLDHATLVEVFGWSAEDFERITQGSAIRRIGHARWLRNVAIALGNAPADAGIVEALQRRADDRSPLVREHVAWAIAEQRNKLSGVTNVVEDAN
jgi:epoxyqueuosine reductase